MQQILTSLEQCLFYYRSIPTSLSKKLVQMDKELKTREEIYQEMHQMRNMKFGMLDGQIDVGYISVGLGVSLIHSIRSSKEIIDDITQDFKPVPSKQYLETGRVEITTLALKSKSWKKSSYGKD